ncbi:hypothetical protein NQ117_10230 [Paenibacillus sp. SC116]|uniref:hypothetical protein n=1 Tax=Paenibacillus sp. SC116 TaxID=2968986 RepID=UPI00215A5995|nr:hypothetical protein [Paenibacillus sp. SC116]MCR8844062.1 hypothetical protein [Paenibacillus sp. SC116]
MLERIAMAATGLHFRMFGNAEAERTALELTYEDSCSVSRSVAAEDADGIVRTTWTNIYDNIACAFSAGSDRSSQTTVEHRIEYEATLYVAPTVSIQAGDRVTVQRFGQVKLSSSYEVVGVPKRYATHNEVRLKAEKLA